MNKKYLICSLTVLSLLGMSSDVKGYQREGCGGGGCNSGCSAPTSSYQGYHDADGPYYDHRGPDVVPLHRDGPPPVSPGARMPDNRKPTRFQGELPSAPTTGDRHHYFNPATVSMFKGDIVSVTRIEGPNGREIVRVVIHTNQGDDVELRTGPASFLEEKRFVLRQGDKIDVKGSKVNWNGRTIIIAQEIKKDGDTLVLRDKEGKPSWKESASELRDREDQNMDNRKDGRDNDNRDRVEFGSRSYQSGSNYSNNPSSGSSSYSMNRNYDSSNYSNNPGSSSYSTNRNYGGSTYSNNPNSSSYSTNRNYDGSNYLDYGSSTNLNNQNYSNPNYSGDRSNSNY